MKELALLFYSIFLFSCNQNTHTQHDNMQKLDKGNYAIELIDKNFLKYTDSSKLDSLKMKIINSFDALINSDTIQLYTQHNLDNDIFWDTAPRIFLRKVNEMLKAKDDDEQFYLLYSGNDLHTLLLIDNQFSII